MTHMAREAADSARWPAGGGLLGGPAAGLRNCEVTRFYFFFFFNHRIRGSLLQQPRECTHLGARSSRLDTLSLNSHCTSVPFKNCFMWREPYTHMQL